MLPLSDRESKSPSGFTLWKKSSSASLSWRPKKSSTTGGKQFFVARSIACPGRSPSRVAGPFHRRAEKCGHPRLVVKIREGVPAQDIQPYSAPPASSAWSDMPWVLHRCSTSSIPRMRVCLASITTAETPASRHARMVSGPTTGTSKRRS